MANDDETVGRIFSRREAIAAATRTGLVLASGGALHQIARAAFAQNPVKPVHLLASPALSEGPFFVDEGLRRADLTSGTSRPTVRHGLPLHLSFVIYQMMGNNYRPLSDAQVDVWHADVSGVYSDESNPMNHEDTSHQAWLRGYQITDAHGVVNFQTIFPGWYPGRCPHIHFKVRKHIASANETREFTSQVFLREQDADRIYSKEPYASKVSRETTNSVDMVYSERMEDGSMAGAHMLLHLAKVSSGAGYKSQFSIVLA